MRPAQRLGGDDHLVLCRLGDATLTTSEIVRAVGAERRPALTLPEAGRVLRLLQLRGLVWGWREPDGSRHWTATDAGRAAISPSPR